MGGNSEIHLLTDKMFLAEQIIRENANNHTAIYIYANETKQHKAVNR